MWTKSKGIALQSKTAIIFFTSTKLTMYPHSGFVLTSGTRRYRAHAAIRLLCSVSLVSVDIFINLSSPITLIHRILNVRH